jgi:5,6-dimethylbenzimidazole synthase
LVRRLLEAAHQAPSVGLMQPWRFILIRSEQTKAAMQALAARERLVQGQHFDDRAREYLDLKIEGIREAPLSICVCCDRGSDEREVLGRHTIRDTDLYSSCLAIENLWLAARAEGIGVGWVSFYREDDVRSLLALPAHVVPVAWLCVGYPRTSSRSPGSASATPTSARPGPASNPPAGNAADRSTSSCSQNVGGNRFRPQRRRRRSRSRHWPRRSSCRPGGRGSPSRYAPATRRRPSVSATPLTSS